MKMVRVQYITETAAESARAKINELVKAVGSVPGNYLSYSDATEIIKFLAEYAELLSKAAKKDRR